MSFALPAEALAWRDKIRAFVDSELQPCELEAEMNEGRISADAARRHEREAIDLGLSRADVPKSHGGLELPLLIQVVIVEQLGRVTNALGWCYPEAQSWMFEAFTAEQLDRLVYPMMRGSRHICYAITESEAGSDPSAIATTAERRGEDYFVNGEKWHVTSA